MSGHPTREEDFDLYALGALEGDEFETIASHVAACDDCAQKLAQARGRVAMLAFAVPPVPPSPGVKERLLRQLHSTAAGGAAPRPAPKPERAGFFSGGWWSAVWAPAAVALAMATILLWVSNNRLNDEMERQRADMRALRQQMDEANALVALASARDTISVALAPSAQAAGASGRVLYNARLGKAFYTDTLPAPPPDKSYQLWLVPASGNPISAGVFAPSDAAGSHIVATLPVGTVAKAFAVTMEPAGGRPQPTGPKILIGPVS